MSRFEKTDELIYTIFTDWGGTFELAFWPVGLGGGPAGWYLCAIDESNDAIRHWRQINGELSTAVSESRRILQGMEREWRA